VFARPYFALRPTPTADPLAQARVCSSFPRAGCPPCKAFTPVLSEWWTAHASEKKTDVVFLSSDRDEGAFKAYLSEMSWGVAVPYENSAVKARLSGQYKVQGIPTLVTVDAKTGEVITTKGREGVSGNPSGWPFRPRALSDVVEKSNVVKAGASRSLAAAIAEEDLDHVLFYFSASWCGPCKAFTPALIAWYNKQREAGAKLEIVFVSADKSQAEFDGYFGKMPWAGLDFSQREEAAALNSAFDVEGIPTLSLVDAKTLKVVHADARALVQSSPDDFPWSPQPIAFTGVFLSSINDMKSAILFTDKAEASTEAAEAGFLATATEMFGSGEVQFGVMTSENPMTARIRDFLGFSGDKDGPDSARLVLLDIPSGVKYELGDSREALSKDGAILEAVRGVFSGTATPKPLR